MDSAIQPEELENTWVTTPTYVNDKYLRITISHKIVKKLGIRPGEPMIMGKMKNMIIIQKLSNVIPNRANDVPSQIEPKKKSPAKKSKPTQSPPLHPEIEESEEELEIEEISTEDSHAEKPDSPQIVTGAIDDESQSNDDSLETFDWNNNNDDDGTDKETPSDIEQAQSETFTMDDIIGKDGPAKLKKSITEEQSQISETKE